MVYFLLDQYFLLVKHPYVPHFFLDKVISVPALAFRFRLPPGATRIAPLERLPEDGVIRIAIPSVAQTLSAGFIRCLSDLEQACPKQVEFVFFLGEISDRKSTRLNSSH